MAQRTCGVIDTLNLQFTRTETCDRFIMDIGVTENWERARLSCTANTVTERLSSSIYSPMTLTKKWHRAGFPLHKILSESDYQPTWCW